MEWLLVVLVVMVAAALAGVVLWQYRQIRALKVDAIYLDALQQQISRLQADLHQLADRVEQRRRPSITADAQLANSPYNQAIELVKQGLSAHDVAERCGISRSEAELIVSLYRNNSTS
ncbi:MAG: DUF2802 domain-containing protein [Pseudogulbenkiania sp.]|nr:DUF2802 domain-containing protein [Pseudogulbenkiania sp.]